VPDRLVSDEEISMVNARMAALQVGTNSCSDRFNTVVLPSQDDDAWDVYVLAATTDPDLIQIGGHTRVRVSREDSEVLSSTPLAKSCISLDKSGAGLPEGVSVAAYTVTHIVSPMPVEIHPFLSLLHDVRLAVATERGVWMISSGKIELL